MPNVLMNLRSVYFPSWFSITTFAPFAAIFGFFLVAMISCGDCFHAYSLDEKSFLLASFGKIDDVKNRMGELERQIEVRFLVLLVDLHPNLILVFVVHLCCVRG